MHQQAVLKISTTTSATKVPSYMNSSRNHHHQANKSSLINPANTQGYDNLMEMSIASSSIHTPNNGRNRPIVFP